MIQILLIGLFLFALLITWLAISTYNNFVTLENIVEKTYGNIDVLLKQRRDEIPALIKTVRGYADHEKEVFKAVVEKRNKLMKAKTPREKATANEELGSTLTSLFAIAEDYPDLKANENFLKLQQRITGLENEISDRREMYNEAVTNLNTKKDQFPALIIANMMDLSNPELFEVDESLKEPVEINL